MNNVAIIIPAVRIEKFALQCIETSAAMYPDTQIILILNEEVPVGAKIPENVEVHYFQENNIAQRRNFAISKTSRTYIALIDSDAYPAKNWLEEAISAFDLDDSIAATGGPNISPPNETRERLLVGVAQTSWLVMGFWLFYKSASSAARYADSLPACNLIVKREVFLALGGMNEGLETGEDTDFCSKLIKNGYKVRFTPKAVVYHYDRTVSGFVKQRLVRGTAVYHHLFGKSELRGAGIKYLLLMQPVAVLAILAIFLTFGMVYRGVLMVSGEIIIIFAALILFEGVRCSKTAGDFIPVTALICLGNLLVGIGFLMQLFNITPQLTGFYRNDY